MLLINDNFSLYLAYSEHAASTVLALQDKDIEAACMYSKLANRT